LQTSATIRTKVSKIEREIIVSETKELFGVFYDILLEPAEATKKTAPYGEIAKRMGVKVENVKALLRTASAQDAFMPFIQDIPHVLSALSAAAKDGNVNAANTFLKYVVMYSPPAALKETLDALKTIKERTPVQFVPPAKVESEIEGNKDAA
jgi:uncharacterized protein YlbG (UPF0298 family)